MEVAMPMSGTAIDCYEDMFKEITRKLYGEDGLPELTGNDRLPVPQERGLTPIDYDVDNPLLKPEEHITAFGLAALMQNGFPTTGILNQPFQQHKPNIPCEDKWIVNEDTLQWTQSKVASYNSAQKLFKCAECDCVGYLPRVAEHWLGTHSNLRVFQCSQCPYESAWARCVKMHLTRQHNIQTEENSDSLLKNNPVLQEIIRYLQRLKSKLEGYTKISTNNSQSMEEFQSSRPLSAQTIPIPNEQQASTTTKRYSCTYCPYATDRRDLFTRHENIHREEKPFQCYVCQKQFNRADHVKKHFLRMHREHPYDLNRIRRHPPKNASGMSYYQKYNATGTPTQSPEPVTAINNQISIPNSFNALSRGISNNRLPDLKPNLNGKLSQSKNNGKKKGDKRFTCCYCSWSGVDNWCLKRHMNTHLKPFVCGLCDYKAARSERLATHVLKVHNKRACGKCTFLADDAAQLTVHQQEHHPLEQRNRTNSTVRNPTFNSTLPSTSTSFSQTNLKQHELNAAAALLQHGNRILQSETKSWKSHAPKQHGAARLFNYMEASDGSEPECDSQAVEEMGRVNLNHRIQLDFPEAGDVGSPQDEEVGEETELPLFVCQTCGCEFEDDSSLETHQFTHRHSSTSPARAEDLKENVNPQSNYLCQVCNVAFSIQNEVITHMITHSSINACVNGVLDKDSAAKRSRKQSQPKRVVLPFWDSDEIEVLRHLNGKLRKWRNGVNSVNVKLFDKYMAQLVTRKGLTCNLCKNFGLSTYHTKGSLALHHYWRHSRRKPFQCEHCNMVFRHRYQVVLHSSKEHVRKPVQTVPNKEPFMSTVPAPEESHNFLTSTMTTPVPDLTNTNVHKIGMSFFDHSFLHSSSTLNNHMPIIIPTFPPN